MPDLGVGEVAKKARGFVAEFREFINRGNVVDIGVAFVIGASFKTVIDAFAGDGKDNPGLLGGLIGAIFGGSTPNFNDKKMSLNGSELPIGALVTASLNFLIVAFALFLIVRTYNRFRDVKSEPTTNELLAEIRDELRRSQAAKQGDDAN
ncbi:MAG: MscL family protein [Actinobacteria bacterium]|nr:MscL family protein [Actinomycetota bacterium]